MNTYITTFLEKKVMNLRESEEKYMRRVRGMKKNAENDYIINPPK